MVLAVYRYDNGMNYPFNYLILFPVQVFLNLPPSQAQEKSGWPPWIAMATRPLFHVALTLVGLNESQPETVILTHRTLASTATEMVRKCRLLTLGILSICMKISLCIQYWISLKCKNGIHTSQENSKHGTEETKMECLRIKKLRPILFSVFDFIL